ncbi:MAG: PQQ-binding-like beta-propeller repeat protein [Dactylosporangium sp.]|nr:PQQ-like beta-propeller repeat protein [Dactylosporangium sp.]NNJ62996.1 PQQ-binding-like beta-propeller repeat protein [Dactylosporangium sp.]
MLTVLAILLAVTFTGYRTLRPAENLSRATTPLPSPAEAEALPYGELGSAPIIVEGRLRVFAEQRKVWAETPVTATRQVTPHWSFRRWPAEAVGVIGVERPFLWGGPALVITKWSDGAVVALEAATGTVNWQTHVEPDPEEIYRGRRTGGQTVYAPEGMFTAVSATDGALVLLVAGRDQLHAYDPRTGAERWAQVFSGTSGCHRVDWTGETTYVVKDSCAVPANLEVFDAATGIFLRRWRPAGASAGPDREANWYVQPVSCRLGRSRCQLFRAAATADVVSPVESARGEVGIVAQTYSLSVTGAIELEQGATADLTLISGDVRVEPMLNGYVWAHSRSSGAFLWISTRPALLLAVDGSSVYLADDDRDIAVVDLHSGRVKIMIDAPERYGDNWLAGFVYNHNGFLAIERLASTKESDDDTHYYYASSTVLLVGA